MKHGGSRLPAQTLRLRLLLDQSRWKVRRWPQTNRNPPDRTQSGRRGRHVISRPESFGADGSSLNPESLAEAGDPRESKCPKSRLRETEPCSRFQCPQKYSILGDYPSCFLVLFGFIFRMDLRGKSGPVFPVRRNRRAIGKPRVLKGLSATAKSLGGIGSRMTGCGTRAQSSAGWKAMIVKKEAALVNSRRDSAHPDSCCYRTRACDFR